jgi:hypothetical protein
VSFFKDIATSKDGESYHFAKVTGLAILIIFLVISLIWYCWLGKGGFDPAIWGGVLTTIYSAINAAIRMTHVTEP